MDQRKYNFLVAVLGTDGAKALRKAAERSHELGHALVPRTILAWLGIAAREDYEGDLPGVRNSYITFRKSESGYTGSISFTDEDMHEFQGASLEYLAAAVAVYLGADADRVGPGLRDLDLARLGKSIDLLVKARAVTANLEKGVLNPSAGYQIKHMPGTDQHGITHIAAYDPHGNEVGTAKFSHHPSGHMEAVLVGVDDDHQRKGIASAMYAHAQKVTGKAIKPSKNQTDEGAALWAGNAKTPQFGTVTPPPAAVKEPKLATPTMKAESPGPAHAPTPAQPHEPPAGPSMQQEKGPKPAKKPKLPKIAKTLRVTKSQSERKCGLCGIAQFKHDRFNGCLCLRDLAKHAKTTADGDLFVVEFKSEWDEESILTLIESLGSP